MEGSGNMSKLTASLFSTIDRKDLPLKIDLSSKAMGILGAIILVTSVSSAHQILHLVGASLCVYGMIWLCAIYEIRTKGLPAYARYLSRDICFSLAWALLMLIWLVTDIL